MPPHRGLRLGHGCGGFAAEYGTIVGLPKAIERFQEMSRDFERLRDNKAWSGPIFPKHRKQSFWPFAR